MEATNAVVPKRNWKNLLNVGAITAAATAMATNAFAVDAVEDLFAVADVSIIQSKTFIVLSAFVLVGLLFKGRSILTRLGVSV